MKEELPTSRDIPATDGHTTKEVESTPSQDAHPQGVTSSGTTTEVAKDNGSHYFPVVPETLDEAPEKYIRSPGCFPMIELTRKT